MNSLRVQLHTQCNSGNEASESIVVALEGFDSSRDKVRHVQSYDSGVHVLLQTGVRWQALTTLPPGVKVGSGARDSRVLQ